jgi:hypothetical protein
MLGKGLNEKQRYMSFFNEKKDWFALKSKLSDL